VAPLVLPPLGGGEGGRVSVVERYGWVGRIVMGVVKKDQLLRGGGEEGNKIKVLKCKPLEVSNSSSSS